MSENKTISIVIPCYNESEVLDALYARLATAAHGLGGNCEMIVVDDGSTDGTWKKLCEIHAESPEWKLVRLSRNFGHQAAVSAGLHYAAGDAVIVMDADLQDPPEVLDRFVEKWREGYEVVYGIRRKRKEGILLRACYAVFYRLLSSLSGTWIPEESGDFCLMDRRVVDHLMRMPEHNRFVRGLRAWLGFRQIGVEYERDARAAGETKYGFRKLVRLAVDGIFSFSLSPLRLATRLGFAISIVAFLGAMFTFAQRVFFDYFTSIGLSPPPGLATIVISILFLGGVQLICLGIVGEYIGRIYEEVKRRPIWVESETIGLTEKHPEQ